VFGGQILEAGQSQQTFFQSIYALSPFNGHWVDMSPEKTADLAYARCVTNSAIQAAGRQAALRCNTISCLLGLPLRSIGHTA